SAGPRGHSSFFWKPGQSGETACLRSTGDPLTWTLNAGPTGMVLDPNTNALIGTPTPDQGGTFQPFPVAVHDSQGATMSQSFTIDVLSLDRPPQIDGFDPPTVAGAQREGSTSQVANGTGGTPGGSR